MTKDDFSRDAGDDVEAAPAPSDADLALVRKYAAQAMALEDEISQLEDKSKAKRAALLELTTRTLPLKMAELGLTRFDLVGGAQIAVDHVIAASLKKDNRPRAFEWLNGNGLGDIIKRTIVIRFGRGEEAWAAKFLRDLAKRKRAVDATVDETVAANTYSATIRERILELRAAETEEAGAALKAMPLELLGVWEGDVAEVKRPKVQTSKRSGSE